MRKTSAKSLSEHIEGFVAEMGLDKVLLGNSLGGHVGDFYQKQPREGCFTEPDGQQRFV